ncbi:hypothetical protein NX86_02740 [Streptococcus phocae subsp. salmonis]|uniref:hypothetical protein n=1 Tax=Streptococcus phocae TaxID=119224 RepID=UPI0005318A05|nr:hypothetical protein NX86_02740 [Streptococcus phocae subsp. salmonis]
MLYADIEPKGLQYKLGHSNISMTLSTYVHATQEGAKKPSPYLKCNQYFINNKGVPFRGYPLTIPKSSKDN